MTVAITTTKALGESGRHYDDDNGSGDGPAKTDCQHHGESGRLTMMIMVITVMLNYLTIASQTIIIVTYIHYRIILNLHHRPKTDTLPFQR